METIIPTIWITVTIWTIIPNLLLAYKYYSKKIKDIDDIGSVHFLCLWFFIITSAFMTGQLIADLLNKP